MNKKHWISWGTGSLWYSSGGSFTLEIKAKKERETGKKSDPLGWKLLKLYV